jgi:hypothetical protein
MKPIAILLSILCLLSCEKSKDEKRSSTVTSQVILNESFIEGSWKLKSEDSIDEDMIITEEGKITFLPSGKFKADTSARCRSNTVNEDIFSFSGVDTGTWRIAKDKLILTYETIGIDKFDSLTPLVTRSVLEEEVKEYIGKDEFYRIKSIKEDSIDLIEEEEQSLYQFTRIKGATKSQ